MRRILLALMLGALLGACAPRSVVRTPPARPLDGAWGLAVYPVLFRFPVSGYESYDRGRKLAEQLSARTGRLVYGPGEFRLEQPHDDDLHRATNLQAALRFSKERRPEGLYGVRVLVEQRVATATRVAYDAAGRVRGATAEQEVEVAVRVSLLALHGEAPVLELEGSAKVDPFTSDLERDPFPDVTALTARLADEAAALAGWTVATAQGPELKVVPVPKPAMAFALPGRRSLEQELGELDALEQDARFLRLMRARDPDAPRPRLRLYRSAPAGLVVREAGGAAAKAGLLPEDLVVAADGEPLWGLHVLDRHLASGRTLLRVRRGSEELELPLLLAR
jgi:hypothetical protein